MTLAEMVSVVERAHKITLRDGGHLLLMNWARGRKLNPRGSGTLVVDSNEPGAREQMRAMFLGFV